MELILSTSPNTRLKTITLLGHQMERGLLLTLTGPDGAQIAFDSDRDRDRDRNWEIYVMNADGTNPINLTQHRDPDFNPSWGPASTLSISPKERLAILWGKVKRPNPYTMK
jgi:hypothetical protein